MIRLKDFPIYSEEFLRQKSEPVADAKEAQEIREQLIELYPDHGALAVAAPQIGILKQAFIIKKLGAEEEYIFVCNPEVLRAEGEQTLRGEGCLSFPGQRRDTIRYKELKVKFLDENFEERTVVVAGIEAIIFQHEIDHLYGVTFKDHVRQPIRRESPKIGRNEPCPCGSNKKYKKCCLPTEE